MKDHNKDKGIPAYAGTKGNYWGKGIAATYIIFVIVTLTMTYSMMTRNVDLVAINYYDKEIKYQDQIDKINNSKRLAEVLKYELTGGAVVFAFPKIGDISGEYVFYRPSDSKQDFKIKIQPDKDNRQAIDLSSFARGYWKVKIEWKSGGTEYYDEEQIIL